MTDVTSKDDTQLAIASCDPSTEKTNAGALSETAAGILFIANLPHTGKQHDCIILSKTDSDTHCDPSTEKRERASRLSAREKRQKLNEAQMSKRVRKKLTLIKKKLINNKLINTIKIVFANNHAYLMLTDFADPS